MSVLPELPLLRRELTELANRRRTYFVRVAGAIIILLSVFIAYNSEMSARQLGPAGRGMVGPMQFLGIGGDIFVRIIPLLFFTIQLLMPALACASITSEKESNTIGTLLLTRLSPGTIIIEKCFSRLVPMLTLILLTFPILAHVFTLGGVDTSLLMGTLWLLLCESLLVASVAILCSAWFPSTVAAFIASYACMTVLAILTLSLGLVTLLPSAIWYQTFSMGGGAMSRASANMISPLIADVTRPLSLIVGEQAWMEVVVPLVTIMSRTIPSLMLTAVLLFTARLVLVPRAFVSHSSVLLKVFRVVDQFFVALNDHTTGGIVLIADHTPLPDNDPVAWRERYKKSLGKARYLFRVLVFLEGPTLFICLAAATLSARSAFDGLFALEALIWTLAVMVTAVKGATLFSSERSRETLAPLLATPMTAVEMLRQKISGMKRLILVLAIPVLTVNFTHFLMHFELRYFTSFGLILLRPLLYISVSIVNVFLLLNLMAWLSAGIGLKIHTQTKAVLASIGVIVLWTTLPLVANAALRPGPVWEEAICTLSPVSPVLATEQFLSEHYRQDRYGRRSEDVGNRNLLWMAAAVTVYSLALAGISGWVSARCPQLLGRMEQPEETHNVARSSTSDLTDITAAEVPS